MVHVVSTQRDPAAVDRILRRLPKSFGDDAAIAEYVTNATRIAS